MKKPRREKPKQHSGIAEERIITLFEEADKAFSKDRKLSNRYVQLALKISTRYKVRLTQELKKRYCKHCHSYLKPAENCMIRLNQGKLVYHCLECGGCMRYPYRKAKILVKDKNHSAKSFSRKGKTA